MHRVAYSIVCLLLMICTLQADTIEGTIQAINVRDKTLTIRRTDTTALFKDWRVIDGDLAIWNVGDSIRGTAQRIAGTDWLTNIWPNDPSINRLLETVEHELHGNTQQRGTNPFRKTGELIPSFALYDQDGQLFQSSQLEGQYTIINFIFTRCLVPAMCATATHKMQTTQSFALQKGIENIQLISISLDPEYDTPGVFTNYATTTGIDTYNFSFLTGPRKIVHHLKSQLGILTKKDESLILDHTMMTSVISPDGKIIHQASGTDWSPDDLLNQIIVNINSND